MLTQKTALPSRKTSPPKEATRSRVRPRACARCHGDAYLDLRDLPEWRCIQCGRTVADETADPSGEGDLWSLDQARN